MPPDIYFSSPEAMLRNRRKYQPGRVGTTDVSVSGGQDAT